MSTGVHYVIEKLGLALSSAEHEIEFLRGKVRELEQASVAADTEKAAETSE